MSPKWVIKIRNFTQGKAHTHNSVILNERLSIFLVYTVRVSLLLVRAGVNLVQSAEENFSL